MLLGFLGSNIIFFLLLEENIEFLTELHSGRATLRKTARRTLALAPDTPALERKRQVQFVFSAADAFRQREYRMKPRPGPQQRGALNLYSIPDCQEQAGLLRTLCKFSLRYVPVVIFYSILFICAASYKKVKGCADE
jgi:hypothetical protein